MGSSGFGTPAVAIATTPTVVSTFFSHIFAKRKRRSSEKKSLAAGGPGGGPENQLSYEEGLKVVRRFIDFSSHHGVEEVQAFTAMAVPTPHWVRRKTMLVPAENIAKAEEVLTKHLASYGPDGSGLKLVGGENWWKIRGRELEGEWIEMQKDYLKRKARQATAAASSSVTATDSESSATTQPAGTAHHHHLHKHLPGRQGTLGSVKDSAGGEVKEDRVILYIHGGAFFFSSLDTHRYQIQRHCRKAGARCFSPAYRLAPQYPFPCGLLDALASYLYLLYPPDGEHEPIHPANLILMGDSAGAGMVLSLLVIIREMGLPMPAGASLVSPWVDLTHSMPSIGGWDGGDFIPSSGFHYRPSCAWPPIPGGGITVTMPDASEQHFDEQIQMYCPNNLLTHPLVTLINQGSLGGLCPLLIVGGGGELLRDEIIYLAHKAANPTLYLPSSITLSQYPEQQALIDKYKPTKVHLQIHEGCCHVVPTLSWTKSAKYMYRACANFNIWAFTAASKGVEQRMRRKVSKRRSQDSGRTGTSAEPSRQSTLASSIPNIGVGSEPPELASLRTDLNMTTLGTESASPVTGTSESGHSTRLPSRGASSIDLTKPIINSSAARAANQDGEQEIDVQSEASSSSEDEDEDENDPAVVGTQDRNTPARGIVTVNGIEPFSSSETIVSERVSVNGRIRPFEPIEAVPALDPGLREQIGQVHGAGAIQKWLSKRAEWDAKYAKDLAKWRQVRAEDRKLAQANGFLTGTLQADVPPLCSLAGLYDQGLARDVGKSVDEISKKTSGAVMLWMKMSSKADREFAGGDSVQEIRENVQAEMAGDAPESAKTGRDRRRSSVSGTAYGRRLSVATPNPPNHNQPA